MVRHHLLVAKLVGREGPPWARTEVCVCVFCAYVPSQGHGPRSYAANHVRSGNEKNALKFYVYFNGILMTQLLFR